MTTDSEFNPTCPLASELFPLARIELGDQGRVLMQLPTGGATAVKSPLRGKNGPCFGVDKRVPETKIMVFPQDTVYCCSCRHGTQ